MSKTKNAVPDKCSPEEAFKKKFQDNYNFFISGQRNISRKYNDIFRKTRKMFWKRTEYLLEEETFTNIVFVIIKGFKNCSRIYLLLN